MAKTHVKTKNFTLKKKYRTVRAALRRADSLYLKMGLIVSIQKRDGQWVSAISEGN